MSSFCPSCGVSLKELKNFCPDCGSALRPQIKLSLKTVLALLFISTLLWYAAWHTKTALQGEKPTVRQEEVEDQQPQIDESALASLREELEPDPKNLEKLKALGQGLATKLLSSGDRDSTTVFELISILDRILEISPEDTEALLNRANISYNFHSYDKAEQYYERYLKLQPDDVLSRTAYASTLTLLEKFDRAESELEKVLKTDPTSFAARANLYVNYIARGDKLKAEIAAKEALKVAPNDEARAKLEDLIKRFSQPETGSETAGPSATNSSPFSALEGYLKAHPITGPKFAGLSIDAERKLTLSFKDFPMNAMPPMPKEKFLNSIKEQLKAIPEDQRPRVVEFLDVGSGSVMERF